RRTAARGPVLPEPDRDGDGTHPWGLSAGAHDQEGPVYRRGPRSARGRRATVVPASGGDEWSGALPARGSWGGDRGDPALFGRHTSASGHRAPAAGGTRGRRARTGRHVRNGSGPVGGRGVRPGSGRGRSFPPQ